MNKKVIIEYLTEKKVYSPVYDFTIDMLISEIKIYKEAVAKIKKEGLTVAGNGDNTFFVQNPNIRTKSESLKNIQSLTKALGLSVTDSLIFKELNGETPPDDGFDHYK